MTSQRPPAPRDVIRSRGEVRGPCSHEHEQRLISQLTLKRNSVLLQLRATERDGGVGGDLASSRRALERLACELERHLEAVNDAAQRGGRLPSAAVAAAHGRRVKRPAPAPPSSPVAPRVSAASSTPELAGVPRGDLVSKVFGPPRHRGLKKSLSLSGSRSFFASMLAALRVGRSRSPALHRRSRSQESLNLAPIDQDQQMVSDAAVRAQQRRGATSNVRSLSAEPRHLPPQGPSRNRHGSGSSNDSPFSIRRPDRLFLGRWKYSPRERSPLTMRPLTPHEATIKPPTPERASPVRYHVQGVSETALYEIAAFEQLIERFLHTKTPRDVTGLPAPSVTR